MRNPQRWLFLFCLSVLPCSARASGVAPAWALLAEARVVGDSIYLSDLLPAQTPLELRDAAGKILLAAAPPPGSSLTLAGERIRGVLPAAARERLAVPPQVLIHRAGRLLTHAEVLAALRTAWQSNQLPGASGREPEDVHFSAPVQVSAIDARLQVRRIDFDPALNQARFLLASSADRRSLPFLVTADLRARFAAKRSRKRSGKCRHAAKQSRGKPHRASCRGVLPGGHCLGRTKKSRPAARRFRKHADVPRRAALGKGRALSNRPRSAGRRRQGFARSSGRPGSP